MPIWMEDVFEHIAARGGDARQLTNKQATEIADEATEAARAAMDAALTREGLLPKEA